MQDKPHIPYYEKFGHFGGAITMDIFWQLFGMFLLYFYTDIFGISAAAAGTMFFVARIWDAANDPLCGLLADRTRTRIGRFRPWLLGAVVPFAVFAILTFTTPDLSPAGKLIWAYITYIGVGMACTAIEIPKTSLLGVSTPDTMDRTGLASWKMSGSYVGCIIAQGMTLWLVQKLGAGSEQAGFRNTMVLYAVMTVISLVYLAAVARERVAPVVEKQASIKTDLKAIVTARPWLVLLIASMPMMLSVCVRNGAIIYYFKYYIGNETLAASYMVTGAVACLIGTFFMKPLVQLMGKRRLFSIMNLIMAVAVGACFFPNPDQLVLLYVLQFIIAVSNGPIYVLTTAMYADIADYIEVRDGTRQTGLVYSASGFVLKFGWAMGGAVAGWVLASVGFVPNVEQTPEAMNGIRHMISTIPAIPALFAALLIFAYPLTEARVKQISDELKNLRNNSEKKN